MRKLDPITALLLKMNVPRKFIPMSLVAFLLWTGPAWGDAISGTVHNQTNGKPAEGDEIVLLHLGEGMQEESHTKADAQGAFSFTVQESPDHYLVRALHQGVNYDQAPDGAKPLEINVYDAVSRIPGIEGSIGMAQIESDGKSLKVTEMYELQNKSVPPVTQSSLRNFTAFLPEKASLDSAQARRGDGIWTKIQAAPQQGAGKQYAINFPLRPGATLFKIIYHMPYVGPTSFHVKVAYPIQKFAVILPDSMKFRALQERTFTQPAIANGMLIAKAISEPVKSDVPAFQVSGTGMVPAPPVATNKTPPQTAPQSATSAQGSVSPANMPVNPENSKVWEIVAVVAGLLVLGAAVWYARRSSDKAQAKPAEQPLLETLKDQLFELENERAKGAISEEEYANSKQALNLNIQRALTKKQ